MPGYYSSSSMIYALLLLALAHPLAAIQPWLSCGQTAGNYEVGSTFETNLQDLLLNTIRQNASSSPSLFAKGSLGAAPDTVWALVLCRRDFSASDCYKCITTAAKGAAGVCNRSRDVGLYYDPCYVRLSSHDFVDPTGNGNSGLVRVRSVTSISSNDVAGYDQAVTALLNATAQHAANNSRMFATGQSVGPDPGFANIYSLAQCAPDLTPPLCQSCLQRLVGDWWNRNPANVRDAVMAGPRCTLRSMLSQFYTGSAMVQLASAPAAVAGTRRGSPTVAMVIGLVVALVAAALLAAGWFWHCRYKSGRQHKTQAKPTGQIQVIPGTSNASMRPSSASTEKESGQEGDSIVDVPRRFSYEELATSNFNKNKKLGEGAFGVVYEGRLPGTDMTVAIKANRETSDTAEEKKAFYNEIKIMSRLHHRNILGFWGWCEEDKHLLLVYEIMENGSLEDHLYPRNGAMDAGVYGPTDNGTYSSSHLGWLSRHNILIGIASGLTYLHKECRAAIVHRDLKPANVMLDKNFNAKLADFGLVTQVNHTQTSRPTDNIIGTRSYIDPAYMDTGKVSGQCDVYSLGVILLEIVCGEKPIILQDGNKNSLIEKVMKCDGNNRILDAAEIGLRGQYDKQIEAVLQLGLQCVLPDRHDRPHTGRVRDRLMEMLPNGKGSTGSTSQPNEDEFGTCRATFRTPSHDDEEAGVSRLISG